MIFVLLGACAHSPELTGFYGHAPVAPIAAPALAALNRDGAPRDQTALLGHPTVLWFYPLAASAG